jgi:hypothetical protein
MCVELFVVAMNVPHVDSTGEGKVAAGQYQTLFPDSL